MIKKGTYLDDVSFLKQLAGLHIKEYFVNIIVLNWQEQEIEHIEGKVISANINIDGNSIIRRTANLSVVLDDTNNNIIEARNLLSINKKINLQIGFTNKTKKYLDQKMLWFPLGVYVITDASISYSDSGLTASLQLKDKMCLLNGECGGTLPASTVFDNYLTIDENGKEVIMRPTIYQIIQQLVNHFGGEQLGKIIISDLDIIVKQAVKWTGATPIYLYKNNGQYIYTVNPLEIQGETDSSNDNLLTKTIFQYGQDIGFIYTDFTYPGDLIGDAGNTVTDILEEIKNVLGNYEYFYDLDGNFIFQEVKNFLNNAQSAYILNSLRQQTLIPEYLDDGSKYLLDINNGSSVFNFNTSNLISSYTNTPKYASIRNDFMVWGIRKNSDNFEIPIRYHLAIDRKPEIGNTYRVFQYTDPYDNINKWYCPIQVDSLQGIKGAEGVYYEVGNQIYTWGENINSEYGWLLMEGQAEEIQTQDWRTELYFQGLAANSQGIESNYYFAELANEWPKIYDIRNNKFYDNVIKNPTQIDFFLDFIDVPSSAIDELNVNNIGRRSKVINADKSVNCVFEDWIPDIILIDKDLSDEEKQELVKECDKKGQYYYIIDGNIYDVFSIGGVHYSAYEEIRQALHEYTKYNETISLQTLPLYHLQPNIRITVENEESGIYGDYIIDSLSFSLDVSSFLSINATRAPEKI